MSFGSELSVKNNGDKSLFILARLILKAREPWARSFRRRAKLSGKNEVANEARNGAKKEGDENKNNLMSELKLEAATTQLLQKKRVMVATANSITVKRLMTMLPSAPVQIWKMIKMMNAWWWWLCCCVDGKIEKEKRKTNLTIDARRRLRRSYFFLEVSRVKRAPPLTN